MKALNVISLDELKKIAATASDDEFIFISDCSKVASTGKSLMGKVTHIKKVKGCKTVWDDYNNGYPSWGHMMWEVMCVKYIRKTSDAKLQLDLDEQAERLERMTGRKRNN